MSYQNDEGPQWGGSSLRSACIAHAIIDDRGFQMNFENKQRWANLVIAIFVVSIIGAVVWDFYSPGAGGRIVGLTLFGTLCVLLRALGRRFLVPKPKK
jgi:hypothetical protein